MRINSQKKIYINITLVFLTIFVIYLIYSFRFSITINALALYGKVSKNPNIERLVGECYYSLSYESAETAQKYFTIALNKYLEQYKHSNHKPTEDKDYHLMEYVIGNSYEYGKGAKKNLYTAKYWYRKAAHAGIHDAKVALDRVNSQIKQQLEQTKQ